MRPVCYASAVLTLLLPSVAAAQLVAYEFVAEVTYVDDPYGLLAEPVAIGDPLTGVFQYDLGLVDDDEDPGYGFYYDDESFESSFVTGTNAASGFFETQDYFGVSLGDNEFGQEDYLYIFGTGDTNPSSLSHPKVDYVDFDVELVDYDQTALTSDALPTSLNLADFEEANIYLSCEWFDPDTFAFELPLDVVAEITSLTPLSMGPAGDFNDDGSVNAADYTVWRDGGLPASDYDDWAANYGVTTGGASAAPEPTAVWLLVLGGLAALQPCSGRPDCLLKV